MLFLTHSTAEAVSVRLSDGVTTVTCNDGDACDVTAGAGVVTFSGAIGNWTVNVTTAITYPQLGSQASPILDLNSVDVTSLGGGTLTIWASEVNYQAPAALTNVPFQLDVGGTSAGPTGTPGTTSFAAFADDGNALFNEATLLGSIGFATTPFAGTFNGSALLSSAYSLTIRAMITHLGPGGTSFDAELRSLASEPAASTLLGWGLGLIGLAGIGRRRMSFKV